MYRLIKGETPSNEDFDSLHKKNPVLARSLGDLCIASGISLFRTIDSVTGLAKYQKGGHSVFEVQLQNGAGKIKSTGKDPNHFTLWAYRDYDFLEHINRMT